jgi:hypothetical protein
MELPLSMLALTGTIVGGLIMFSGFRKRDQKPVVFDNIDGALKDDWTRTGTIDFHVSVPESASPQPLTLRVEERKIVENALGQDVMQLRWRLATLGEAKEIVVCWNRVKSAERDERGTLAPAVLNIARRTSKPD